MSISTLQISQTPNSEVMFQLFHNEAAAQNRPYFPHSHSEYEITIFVKGKGIYTVDKKRTYHVGPGDILIFRSNEEHWLGSIEDGEDVQTIGIHFLPQIVLSQESNLFDIRYLRAFLAETENYNNLIPSSNPTSKAIIDIFEQMQMESNNHLQDFELMIKAKLLVILVEINRFMGFVEEKSIPEITRDQLIQISKSIKYIEEHLTEEIYLDDIADAINVSKSYFSHLFKTVNRISPMDYIISKRIEMAKDMLQHTDKSVLDIMLQCGFNNPANFNRAFRRKTGLSPLQYRKTIRNYSLLDIDW